jgi:hypothetical protein
MAGVEHARTHDGLTDKTAIPVRNTSVEEFSHFLWVFYNPYVAFSYHILLNLTIVVSIESIFIPPLQLRSGVSF